MRGSGSRSGSVYGVPEGIADEVRGKLAGLSGLGVIARSSSSRYRAGDKSPSEMRWWTWPST